MPTTFWGATSKAPHSILVALRFIFLLFACPFSVYAQTGTATLSGTIMDPQGKVVSNVEVNITNIDTAAARVTKTNGDGIYVVTALQPGHYRVFVTKQGFKQITLTDVTLNTQDIVSRNFNLQVGATSETVTVSTNAGLAPVSDSPAVGMLVNRDFVENLPLNGRSFQDLIALAPGTVSSNTSPNGLFSINGQRDDANYFSVDGIGANTDPGLGSFAGPSAAGSIPAQTAFGTTQTLASIDSMQEFRIQTSSYSAEFGRQPGGQIEITTRSGTNDLHGSLFDYFRNEALDANNWFFNHQIPAIPREPERQNDFGGTLAGPVLIPGLYQGKNRSFFFVSYEGLRLELPQFDSEYVPSLAFRQTAAPSVQPFLSSYPVPNHPDQGNGTALFTAGYATHSGLDSINVRLDHEFSSKVHVFARFAGTRSQASGPQSPQTEEQLQNLITNNYSFTLGTTVNLSNNVVNDFRFNRTHTPGRIILSVGAVSGSTPFQQTQVVNSASLAASSATLVFVLIPNSSCCDHGLENQSQLYQQHQYNLVDSLAWTRGQHSMKFGIDYRRLQPTYSFPQNLYAAEFSSQNAFQQGYADFAGVQAIAPAYPIFTSFSAFASDEWKATRRLTITYGSRWELAPSPGSRNGILPLSVNEVSNPSAMQLQPRGTPLYKTSYTGFAPRLGFALNLRSSTNEQLVLRGGAGVFYDTGQALGASGFGNYPFSAFAGTSNVSVPISPAQLPPPSLSGPLTPPYLQMVAIDPNLKLPYVEEWSMSLDQSFGAHNTMTLSYVGNAGHRLISTQSQNLGQLNPNFTQVNVVTNAGASNYHALQVQDQGYIVRGLQLQTSYTWAHAIDNLSTDNGPATFLFGLERGNSTNDVRQVFNAGVVYRIPGTNESRFAGPLTRGWSLDSRVAVQTGYPVEVFQGVYTNPENGWQNLLIRPDLVPGVPVYLHGIHGVPGGWELNPAAFSSVPVDPNTGVPTRLGTLGRNFLHFPNFVALNTAVQRTFSIHESLQLDFRAEAFNLINHPNFNNLDAALGDPTFGQLFGTQTVGVTNNPLYATGSARSLQLMLKLHF